MKAQPLTAKQASEDFDRETLARIDARNMRGVLCAICEGSTLWQSHRSRADGHSEHIMCPAPFGRFEVQS